MTKEIRHRVIFNASPEAVFDALINSRKHAAFTGRPAKLSSKPGALIRCYGDYIAGRILEVERAKLIVMAWRSQHWPRETYSIVSFKFSRRAGGKTLLVFKQVGVPADDCKNKDKGWHLYYWQPLKLYLEK